MIKIMSILLLSLGAYADQYLVQCNHDQSKLCKVFSSQGKKNTICKVPESEFGAEAYTAQIVSPPDDSWTGTIAEWLGLNPPRDWAYNEVLAEGERIVCRIDQDKLSQLRAERQAERQAERNARAAEVDRLDKLDKAKRQYCQKPNKNNLEKILCAEWRREALEE